MGRGLGRGLMVQELRKAGYEAIFVGKVAPSLKSWVLYLQGLLASGIHEEQTW